MLALTRKLDEVVELVIPGRTQRIKLTILDIGRSRVKIGIDAAREIEIIRSECLDANRRPLEAFA